MSFPKEDWPAYKLAWAAVTSDDRVERQCAEAALRARNLQAQERQAAALEQIAAALERMSHPDIISGDQQPYDLTLPASSST